ncbi:hypothetical protein CPC16_005095, partial [Podila verticillata]
MKTFVYLVAAIAVFGLTVTALPATDSAKCCYCDTPRPRCVLGCCPEAFSLP